jgi:hypothetical protein
MTSLMTLPIRLPLEITLRAAKLGVGVLRTVTALIERDAADDRAPWPVDGDGTPPTPTAEPIIIEPEVVFDAEPIEEPAHVDREAELAYEAGPAEDAGAEVRVDAPWDGYDGMRAADIVARLKGADAATRAVVRLYEQQGKARTSVLAATS